MKKKAEITAINPTAIIGTLLHYYSKEKGSDEILGYLEASLDMLPEIERPHVERCVSDELAGAIAALVALICTNKSKAALGCVGIYFGRHRDGALMLYTAAEFHEALLSSTKEEVYPLDAVSRYCAARDNK